MATRYLQDSLKTNAALAAVSDGAERLFVRLLTYADDYARFAADLTMIRAHCYPRMLHLVSEQDIHVHLGELVREGLVRLYHERDHFYGELLGVSDFFGPPRARKPRYPDPTPDNTFHTLPEMTLSVSRA